jgi:NAD(P)-dependent dehydrogenase (short-subunit alcohol dehydrogenase family)
MMSAIVVLGATGRVGRGLVAAAVSAGRSVIAIARQQAELRQLRAEFPGADLTLLRGSVDSDSASGRLAAALRQLARPLAGVVVAICSECERGRVLERSAAALRRALDHNLLAHLNAARHLLPLLGEARQPRGYLLVGGPGGERPWSGYAHRSIVAASLQMLARVLHEEARAMAVRVQLLSVESPLRHEGNLEHACECWPTPQAVGRRALQLLDQPERGNRAVIVPFTPLPEDATRVDARALVADVLSRSHPKDCPP